MTLEIGDIVETVKGAKFWGRLDQFYKGGWGAVVVAIDPGFEGCTHVYPLSQLQRRALSSSGSAAPVAWRDESMALHWIDRYAAGLDEYPQMDRILDCVAASPLPEERA